MPLQLPSVSSVPPTKMTAAQATALHRLGCGFVQGFLFSHPLDIDAAAALVSGDASEFPAPPLVEAN